MNHEIEKLHQEYGANIPAESFTPEVYQLLLDFKAENIENNWLDNDVIWALANIDRYNCQCSM